MGDTIRLDKWLWFARFFKSRSLAAAAVSDAPMRVNGTPVSKPAHAVRVGDTLTFVQARAVRIVRIEALGTRRGPAPEAALLYADLSPAPAPSDRAPSDRAPSDRPPSDRPPSDPGTPQAEQGGRPTGKARRAFDALRDQNLSGSG